MLAEYSLCKYDDHRHQAIHDVIITRGVMHREVPYEQISEVVPGVREHMYDNVPTQHYSNAEGGLVLCGD